MSSKNAVPSGNRERFLQRQMEDVKQDLVDKEYMLATEKEEVYGLKETIRRLEIEVRDTKRELYAE